MYCEKEDSEKEIFNRNKSEEVPIEIKKTELKRFYNSRIKELF